HARFPNWRERKEEETHQANLLTRAGWPTSRGHDFFGSGETHMRLITTRLPYRLGHRCARGRAADVVKPRIHSGHVRRSTATSNRIGARVNIVAAATSGCLSAASNTPAQTLLRQRCSGAGHGVDIGGVGAQHDG